MKIFNNWNEVLHAFIFFVYLIGGYTVLWYGALYEEEIKNYFEDLFDFEEMLSI